MTAAPAGASKAAAENDDAVTNAQRNTEQLKQKSAKDLSKDSPAPEDLPAKVDGPNDAVPEGQVEITRKAKKGEPSDPSGNVTNRTKTGRQRAPKKDPLKEISDYSKLPVAAAVGQVTAAVEEYAGRAVLSVSLRGWVGEAPLKILASDIGDLEQVISELRSQLS